MFELTKQLMAIPSITGTERAIGEFLAAELARRNYRVETQEVEKDRLNVIAWAGGRARLVLCTHIDTVPPMLPVREDDQFLYGRGACDTKGIMAAMLEAGDRLRQAESRISAISWSSEKKRPGRAPRRPTPGTGIRSLSSWANPRATNSHVRKREL